MNKKIMMYALCGVAIIFQLVAIVTTNWSVKSGSGGGVSAKISYGLWKSCAKISGGPLKVDKCVHIPTGDNKNFPKHSLNACRAFAIIGVVCMFVAVIYMGFCRNGKRWVQGLLIAGAVSAVLTTVIWAAELLKFKDGDDNEMKFNPGYSFYLNLVGGVLSVGAAGYFYWGK